MTTSEQTFQEIRNSAIRAREAMTAAVIRADIKYGSNWSGVWMTAKERSELESLRSAKKRAETVMWAWLTSHSPRIWEHGVPAAWVVYDLSFADAMRPLSEPLSVEPPKAYGA